MMAVWGLTGLNKPMIPMYEPVYDLRVIVASLKTTLGIDEITPQTLEAIAVSSGSNRCPRADYRLPPNRPGGDASAGATYAKNSRYGRELGNMGIQEFVSRKIVRTAHPEAPV
jgi:hypothetical protein